MKFPKLALFAALLSPILLTPAFAQRGGGHGGGVHVGGGVRGGFVGGVRGGYHGGRTYYYGGRPYWGPSLYFGLGSWGYPAYGYYGYAPYYYGYDPYAYPPPPVAMDQGPGYPTEGQSQPAPQMQPQQGPPQPANVNQGQGGFYLIAFNDHTIQAATAYKVEGDQIHWMTREGKEMQAPLSNVDIKFSEQINRDRHVDFRIP